MNQFLSVQDLKKEIYENPEKYCSYIHGIDGENHIIPVNKHEPDSDGVIIVRQYDYMSAKVPIKMHSTDSGYDVYFAPLTEETLKHLNFCTLTRAFDCVESDIVHLVKKRHPRTGVKTPAYMIPGKSQATLHTGLTFDIPHGWEIQVRPTSGKTKNKIIAQFGTVDAGYTGELQITVINNSFFPKYIFKGDKIAQLVPSKVDDCAMIVSREPFPRDANAFESRLKLYANRTNERGNNGFGSTD